MSPIALHALARAIAGLPLNGELAALPDGPARRMAAHLDALDLDARPAAWSAMMAARDDATELVNALARIDPDTPPPERGPDPVGRPATLADVRRLMRTRSQPRPE